MPGFKRAACISEKVGNGGICKAEAEIADVLGMSFGLKVVRTPQETCEQPWLIVEQRGTSGDPAHPFFA